MDNNFPVRGLVYYRNGAVEVIREALKPAEVPRGDRREITKLSFRSRSRMMFVLVNSDVRYKSMLTLTYGMEYPVDGRMVKRSLNAFLVGYRAILSPLFPHV